ncbi:MAG: elongation factor P 5-aminopentanone reductase [Oscillospiraceae bacterium]
MKTVLITGASRGIGAACARKFAAEGFRVAINYNHSKELAEALAEELGGIAVQADVADPVQVQKMVDTVLDKFCQLDILVCNAGVSHVGLLSDMTDAEWRRLFAVNVDGVFHCCRAVIPHFVHRKSGRIVTVSSMWGQVGASCEAAYSASKAAVIGLTRALAKELGPSGISANCVAPGVIDTDMNRALSAQDLEALKEETPLERIGTAAQVADAVWFFSGGQSDFITGQVLGVNGGLVL